MQKSSTKIVFFGTSEFAVPALEALKNAGYEIAAVITNPDEPTGRKKIPTPPPVKVAAQKLGLKVFQFQKLEIGNWKLEIPDADVGVIAAYGKIIPVEIINLPRLGIVNIHPSLLPKYRGPTPIQTTILNGEKETGVTIIKIDEEVDHGDIISNFQFPISNEDNYKIIEAKSAKVGADLLIKILPDFLASKIEPQPQDHLRATFTKKFTREDARINWTKTAEEIDSQIRALNPEPGVWTTWNGKTLKILEAEAIDGRGGQNGRVSQEEKKILVGTGGGSIILKIVQLEGKRATSAEDFARGNGNFVGAVLE